VPFRGVSWLANNSRHCNEFNEERRAGSYQFRRYRPRIEEIGWSLRASTKMANIHTLGGSSLNKDVIVFYYYESVLEVIVGGGRVGIDHTEWDLEVSCYSIAGKASHT